MVEYKNILFCTDFSEDANIAFLHALDLAKKYKGKLHILHVPHSSYAYCKHIVPEDHSKDGPAFEKEMLKEAEQALKEAYEDRVGDFKDYLLVVKGGSPDVEIIRYAKDNAIDVIVMGALGKSELERIEHGSTVSNVAKYAHCHVIAIRNPAKRFTLPGQMY